MLKKNNVITKIREFQVENDILVMLFFIYFCYNN